MTFCALSSAKGMDIKMKVNNLKKDFKDVEALKGISFEFEAPSFVGVIGHNGSGKMTTHTGI